MTDWPGLRQLMGSYVIDGWPNEPGSIWAILDDFIEGERVAERVPTEVRDVLVLPEDEIADLVRGLGASYDPAYDGLTYRAWLEELARRITAALPDDTG